MRKLKNILFLSSILLFLAFNFQGNLSGWYQQFLPELGGATIADMTFTDSLNGYMVSNQGFDNNNYILKTTNGGDNWNIVVTNNQPFVRIYFVNSNVGFTNAFQKLYKTTNAGVNWSIITLPGDIFGDDMFVLNQDTIWLVNPNVLVGGVFRTTNGGMNWTRQLAIGNENPTNIYFYNKDIGFAAESVMYKTTNGGINWFNTNQTGFGDMQFINENTGWKSYGPILKTTDGGLNWINLPLPDKGGNIAISRVNRFHALNEDTIWGVGAVSSGAKGLIYLTTDGGKTWGYQRPNPSFNIFQYTQIQITDRLHIWAYAPQKGVHSVTGGNDSTIIVSVNNSGITIPQDFILYQNYPNPFNPSTKINYELQITNYVTLKVYDLQGKEIQTLVNKKQSAGNYSVEFNGANLSSGIYFYTLQTENYKETKKMILVK